MPVNISTINKKVLLRERKRHTARRVASTPYVVLTGYPPSRPDLTGGGGYPAGGIPDLGTPLAGYPHPRQGTPRQGTPLAGYSPPGWTWQGIPLRLDLAGYPPQWLPHGILGNVAKHYGMWTDRRTDTCQNITFPSYYVRGR